MDARRFGEVDVRRQAFLLVDGDLVGLEIVVEVARHQVGIGGVGAVFARNRQPTLPGHPMDPLHQFLGQRAVGDLLADLAHLHRRQRVVEPGQEGSQSESHRFIVSPSPSMRRPPDRPGLLKLCARVLLYMWSLAGESVRDFLPEDYQSELGAPEGGGDRAGTTGRARRRRRAARKPRGGRRPTVARWGNSRRRPRCAGPRRVDLGDDQELDSLGLEVVQPGVVVAGDPVPAGPRVGHRAVPRDAGVTVIVVHQPVAMRVDVDVSDLVAQANPIR